MSWVLYGASRFNQDIGGWHTSQVSDMSWMLCEASGFSQDSGGWSISQVGVMSRMFHHASSISQGTVIASVMLAFQCTANPFRVSVQRHGKSCLRRQSNRLFMTYVRNR